MKGRRSSSSIGSAGTFIYTFAWVYYFCWLILMASSLSSTSLVRGDEDIEWLLERSFAVVSNTAKNTLIDGKTVISTTPFLDDTSVEDNGNDAEDDDEGEDLDYVHVNDTDSDHDDDDDDDDDVDSYVGFGQSKLMLRRRELRPKSDDSRDSSKSSRIKRRRSDTRSSSSLSSLTSSSSKSNKKKQKSSRSNSNSSSHHD